MSTSVLLLRSVAAVIGAAHASLHGISVDACSSLLPAAHTRGHLVESELQLQNWAAYCKQLGKQVSKAAKANTSTMPRSGGLRFFIASASMRCRVQPFRFPGLGAITKLARLIWIAAFVAAAPAMAAERALKAPWQSPVGQAYNWTGLYVGAHLGYAWGPSNWSAPPDLSSSLDFDQSSDIFTGNGSYIGGLQIGYDYMLPNRVVLGVQVDASFPGFPNLDGISTGGMSIFSAPATGLASYTESVLSSGTVRGRFGYAPGNWLFYATGGFAWTYDQLTLTQLADGTTDSPFLWRLGWAAGLGVEYALAPNWTVNIEYLFTKYGNSSVMFPSAGLQFTSDLSLQQARASLNYRFAGGGTSANGGSTGLPTPATDLVNFHGQTTFVWQGYPAIRSPYAGPFSLPGSGLGRETFDATLYAGIRLWQGAEVWITPEIDQGFGFADTHGVAGFPSGESYKLGSSYPYTRMQRIFFRQTVNLGGEVEKVDADISQFAGTRTENRLVLTIGKFAIVDIFDANKYANSPKTDFLNWSLINAGTFDYAGDGWGYTYGAAAEWYQGSWTLRAGVFDLSKTPAGGGSPHGGSLDPTFQQYAVLAEIEKRYELWGQPGKLKVTGFVNRGRAGRFQDAIALAQITGEPADIIAVRSYTSRPGVSMNLEQQISDTVGVFARAGWADGNIEPWDFTDIDRTVSGGVSINGKNWGRPDDTIGIAGVYNNISSVHRAFFDAGGLGILIGDGQLPNPGPERIFEAYYSYALPSNMRVSFDYQFIANPAYNTDRGPVNVFAGRFHARF
jgi:high affinity Mn2+ porin